MSGDRADPALGRRRGQFSRDRWPPDGPVRALLAYLDELHREAGQPSLAEIGKDVALARSTVSAFFTGARLVSRGNLELLVTYLGGDVEEAEHLRRRAATAWNAAHPDRDQDRPGPGAGVRPLHMSVPATHHELDGDPHPSLSSFDAPIRAAARLDVVMYEAPVNTLNRPEQLFGRDDLIEAVTPWLDDGRRVLLYGLPGIGKTALAAALADQRVSAGHGPYVWIRCGLAEDNVVFDALGRFLTPGPDQDLINKATGDARLLAIQAALAKSDVTMYVLDDVWNPPALFSILRAIPDGIAVLMTSRITLRVDNRIEVTELAPAAATRLLATHAKEASYAGGAAAEELCRVLGFHTYGIEIAGHHLSHYGLTPSELREQIAGAPQDLPMPSGFAPSGRESVKRLLDSSVESLSDPDARSVLTAFGGFFSGSATVSLLATHLGFEAPRVARAMHLLVDLSLVKRLGVTESYEMHNLTFGYVRALFLATGAGYRATVDAARRFVTEHVSDHDLLKLDLENLLGAAQQARCDDVDAFIAIVDGLATGGYLDDHGHPMAFLRMLDDAIETIRGGRDEYAARLHYLVSKRANAHYNQGEMARAVEVYREALGSAPDPRRQAVLLGVIGKVLAELGEHDAASEHFQQAYALADVDNDDQGRLRILEQHSVGAFRQHDYLLVRELTLQGVEVSRRLGSRSNEAIFLSNLGSAEFELGVRASLERHEQAHAIAAELNDDVLLALTHRLLGIDHHAREDFDQARANLDTALTLYQKLAHSDSEAKIRKMMHRFGYET